MDRESWYDTPEVRAQLRAWGRLGGRPRTVQHKETGPCRCADCRKKNAGHLRLLKRFESAGVRLEDAVAGLYGQDFVFPPAWDAWTIKQKAIFLDIKKPLK